MEYSNYQQVIDITISTFRDLNMDDSEIVQRICLKYTISKELALQYIKEEGSPSK